MKNEAKFPIGIGVSSMLLVVVALCLTMFGTLALQTAQADWSNSDRNAAAVAAYYQADAAAQDLLYQMDEILLTARCDAEQAVEEGGLDAIVHRAVYGGYLDPNALQEILFNDSSDQAKRKSIYHRLAVAGISSLKAVRLEAEREEMEAAFTIQVDENRSLTVTLLIPPYGTQHRYTLAEYRIKRLQSGEAEAFFENSTGTGGENVGYSEYTAPSGGAGRFGSLSCFRLSACL